MQASERRRPTRSTPGDATVDNRYVTVGWLCQTIKRAARQRVLSNDSLADIRQMGTLDDELLAVELVLALRTTSANLFRRADLLAA